MMIWKDSYIGRKSNNTIPVYDEYFTIDGKSESELVRGLSDLFTLIPVRPYWNGTTHQICMYLVWRVFFSSVAC